MAAMNVSPIFTQGGGNMRKQIALAVALALGSTLAIAAGDKGTSAGGTGSAATIETRTFRPPKL
jgi:hypothetical protein